jgi:hypothetical protein
MKAAAPSMLILMLAAATAWGQMSEANCPMHAEHATTAETKAGHSEAVNARGDHAMGFLHAKTVHHFLLTNEGGVIVAEANDAADAKSIDAIRSHFHHIAQAFAAGDFALPMFIHERNPPGVPEMKRLRNAITYSDQRTQLGARVTISTKDKTALDAIHAFLKFQIEDHQTGDSTAVEVSRSNENATAGY